MALTVPTRLEEAIDRKVWGMMKDALADVTERDRNSFRPGQKPPTMEQVNFNEYLGELAKGLKSLFPQLNNVNLIGIEAKMGSAATNADSRDVLIAGALKGQI